MIIEDRWYDDFYNTMIHQYILSSVLEAQDLNENRPSGPEQKTNAPLVQVPVYPYPRDRYKSVLISEAPYKLAVALAQAASVAGE